MPHCLRIHYCIGLLCTSLSVGCVATNQPPGGVPPGVVTLIQYNDFHARLTPHMDVSRVGNQIEVVERGGIARAATLVKQIRAENPHSLLMNIGDTFHGGVEGRFTLGNAVAAPINTLGIDIGVPGNWDFAYNPAVFMARYMGTPFNLVVKRPNFPNLAANLFGPLGRTLLPATKLIDLNGVVIGFIGLTSDIVPRMHPGLVLGFRFTQGKENYRNLINKHASNLRAQGAHVVALMSELGLHKNVQLAHEINPGSVDVIFTSHTHETTFTPLNSASGAWVVEAGNDGYLGRMDISVVDGAVVDRQWKLLPIGADIAEDRIMKNLVDTARAKFLDPAVNLQDPMVLLTLQKLTQPIDTVISSSTSLMSRRHALESDFNNAFADLLRQVAGTQIAIGPGFRFDTALAPGANITIEDVYKMFPVQITMATAQITGSGLRSVLETALTSTFSTDSFSQWGGWFPALSGVRVAVDMSQPDGARIQTLTLKETGQLIADTTVVSVAGCVRPLEVAKKLCGYAGFSNFQNIINPATNAAYTVADIIIDNLQSGAVFSTPRQDIDDVSLTPFWPEIEFIQPFGLLP